MTKYAQPSAESADKIKATSAALSAGLEQSGEMTADPGQLQRKLETRAFSTADVLTLQRSVGNSVVQRLISQPSEVTHAKNAPLVQPKLMVGPARDRYEQEADRVAAQVTAGGQGAELTRVGPQVGAQRQHSLIQREDTEEEEEEKEGEEQTTDSSNSKDDTPYTKHNIDAEYRSSDLKGSAPTRFKLSVIVWRPGEHYLPLQKARAWSKVRNTLRSVPIIKAFTRKAKTSDEMKKGAARRVARKQSGFKDKSEDEQKQDVNTVLQHADHIGHTWVRLSAYVGDTLKESSSWGFWPKNGFTNPSQEVEGEVKEYDHVHDNDTNVMALDSQISAKQYDTGVGYAASMIKNTPQYKLIGFNCTKFAKKMADTVGGRFPGNGNVFPAEPSQGFFQRIFSPDSAYASLEKNKDSYEGKDLEKLPKKSFDMSGFWMDLSGGSNESEEEDGLEMPASRSVHQLGKDLVVKNNRGTNQTIKAGKLIMVITADSRDNIQVEAARDGTDFGVRGTTNIKDFYAADPVAH